MSIRPVLKYRYQLGLHPLIMDAAPSDVGGVDKRAEVSLMGRRTLKADDVEGFMVAFWDEVMDTVREYRCTVHLDVRLSVKRGVFSFNAMASRVDEEGDERPCGNARVDWPSHKYTSVHAALLSLGSKLSLSVMNDYRERTGDWLHGEVPPAPPLTP